MITNLREQAWQYFTLHAGQRMSIFNFYITISIAIVAGIGVFLGIEGTPPLLIIIFGIFLIIFSFVFWGLDKRTQELIHLAEEEILKLENRDANRIISLISIDRINTDKRKCRIISYSTLFKIIYFSFIIFGIILIIFVITQKIG